MENWDCCGRSRRQRIFFSFLTITITITIGRPRCVVNCCMSDHIHIHCGRWIFTLFVFLGSFSALKLSSREVWRAKIPQLLPLTIVIPSNRQVSISLSLSVSLWCLGADCTCFGLIKNSNKVLFGPRCSFCSI
jgi:hypothetical protein